ncbi:MAG TPA: family 20 glycosylhydrolase [Candidatus Acidoferrales bacterium]|jgi:hexosaminidase|nr:family 20 glycosylhydrolase [Candidatus Acidoferrales bacterium]
MLNAQSNTPLNIMPLPAKVERADGSLKIETSFRIAFAGYHEPRLERAGLRLEQQIQRQTGFVILRANKTTGPVTLEITTDHESKAIQELGEDESYSLDVTPIGAKLHAANPLGTLRGLQTFLQLIAITPEGFNVPALHIEDRPRFPWRGLMIDSGRHFIPMDVLKRNLDGMEAVKMNVFHWHLSENQGFRAESRKFPKLHEQGSDGLFYTQEEIREIVEYARDRGIRVVPEFDMPGHSTAWFAGYPELASGSSPYAIERQWGVFDPAMDPTDEKTYKFLNEFIGEMARLFPDQFFHIGGDEVNGKEWDANPKIQAFMKSHHIKSTAELQAYFSGRVQELVAKHKKTPVGWDEVLVPGVPKTIVIQSWRGVDSLAAAAKMGYRGILSNGYYLDLGWSAARHYTADPLGGPVAALTPEQKQLILGGESCIWSEYVNAENIDSRIWPRNAAIAERLWSPEGASDVASMYARMDTEATRLEWLGLTHRSFQRGMLQRIAGSWTPAEFDALRALAQALEHQKDYSREASASNAPTSLTPLNRLVDAVYPESDVSRRFSLLVDQFVGSSCNEPAGAAQIRGELEGWASIEDRLQPLAQHSHLVKEAAPASGALSRAARIAMDALDAIQKGTAIFADQKKMQLATLDALEQQAHKSQLTIPELPAFQKLVEAAAGGVCTK